jgi:hypothetical protein
MMGILMPAQVLAIGHMRDGDYKYVEDDIRGVVKAAKEAGTHGSARLCLCPQGTPDPVNGDEWSLKNTQQMALPAHMPFHSIDYEC